MRRRRLQVIDLATPEFRAFHVFPVTHTEDDPELFFPPDTSPGQAAVAVNFQDIGYGIHAIDFDLRGGFWRFQNIRIDKGAKIRSAHLLLRGHSVSETGEHQVRFRGLAEDNPARLSATNGGTADENRYADFDSRPKTLNFVDWLTTPKTSAPTQQSWISPDLSLILQEIVDRSGWSNGNALGLYVESILDKYRIQDTFTGSNGTTLQSHMPDKGSGWTKEGAGSDIDIQSNKIQSTAGAGSDSEQYTEDTVFSYNQYEILTDVTSASPATGDGFNIYFQWTDSSNHYVAEIRQGQNWNLKKVVGGTPTTLDTAAPVAHDASFALKIHVHHANGSLEVYKNGSELVLSSNNEDITDPGQVGLQFIDNTFRLDNFDVRGAGIFLTARKYNATEAGRPTGYFAARLIVKLGLTPFDWLVQHPDVFPRPSVPFHLYVPQREWEDPLGPMPVFGVGVGAVHDEFGVNIHKNPDKVVAY